MALEKKGPQFIWKEVSGAAKYQLEISKDKNFSKIFFAKETVATEFNWPEAQPGIYYWHVRAIDSNGKLGDFSTPALLDVTISPPAIVEKYKKVDVSQNKFNEIPIETIVLRWK